MGIPSEVNCSIIEREFICKMKRVDLDSTILRR